MLVSLCIQAQRHQQAVVLEHLAIDEHDPDVELTQGAGEELTQLLGAQGDKAARDRALRAGPLSGVCGQRVQRAVVLAGRDPGGDALQGVGIERVVGRGPGEARQGLLAPVRAHPQARHLDPAPTEGHLARGAAPAVGPALGVMAALGPAQHLTLGLHHGQQCLATGGDAQLVESLARIEQRTERRQGEFNAEALLIGGLAFVRMTAMLRHGGTPSFGFERPCLTTRQVKESPPLFQLSSTEFGTFPVEARVVVEHDDLTGRVPHAGAVAP